MKRTGTIIAKAGDYCEVVGGTHARDDVVPKNRRADQGESAAELISRRITGLVDWRGKTLRRMRKLIKEADPARLFNSSLGGNARRAIDIHEGEKVDESAFKALVLQAVALNKSRKPKPSRKAQP